VVIDSRLETPPDAAILDGGNVLIAAAQDHAGRAAALRARGAEIVVLPNANGKVELAELLRRTGPARHQRSAGRGRDAAERFAAARRLRRRTADLPGAAVDRRRRARHVRPGRIDRPGRRDASTSSSAVPWAPTFASGRALRKRSGKSPAGATSADAA
jgi:hypothetical protein